MLSCADEPNCWYLSTEPLLLRPEYVASMAEAGYATPPYAYAANNPLSFVDYDGFRIFSNVSVAYDYTTPGSRPNTRFTSYSSWHTACRKVGGKWKFDATVNSVLDVFMAERANRLSLHDGNACTIAEHEEKHVQDFVNGLEDLDRVFRSEGFHTKSECENAARSFQRNLRPYFDFLTAGTRSLRDPFDFAR